MFYSDYYALLSRLVDEFPEFYGKSEYVKVCSVDVNPLKHELDEVVKFSAVYDEFKDTQMFYENMEVVSHVEDFYVKSYLGGDVFLASFSDTGVAEQYGEGFVKNVLMEGILGHVVSPDGEASREIAAAVWSDVLTSNPKMRRFAGKANVDDLFKTELKMLTREEYWNSIDAATVTDVVGLLEDDLLIKPVVDSAVANFWKWNEKYYYGDLSQTYRFLSHPKLEPNVILQRMYELNSKVAKTSSFKNPIFSLNMCLSRHDEVELTSAGLNVTGCRQCGRKEILYPVRNGSGVRPTLNFCSRCYKKNTKMVVKYIKKGADGVDGLNPYSVLLKDMMYGVITEQQLVSMAYDFPELREEIMMARNATENVGAVFAFTETKPATK